jgi:outer membrane protein
MKKLIVLAIAFIASTSSFAQKYAFVDSKLILESMPEYTKAQKQIDDISAMWQKEVEKKYKEIDEMYRTFQAEQVLLNDDMKKRREQEIMDKEKAVKEYQKAKFGYEGELFKKRQELIKPIQDKIYDAIQRVCQAKSIDFVMDKSASGTPVLYYNANLDRTNDIMKELGLKK